MGNVPDGMSLGFDTSRAACRGHDVEVFFPKVKRGNSVAMRSASRDAVAVCARCEVREPCLEYALQFEPLGIWGGMNEVEREVLRRQRNIRLPLSRSGSSVLSEASRKRIKSQAVTGE
jgi:WhiB family redox-sensing transcriptional regulator